MVNVQNKTITRISRLPGLIGIEKSICRAIAPPRISAIAVAIEASIAVDRMMFLRIRLMYVLAASERQSPVTMPRWAALCCRRISMIVESVTIHRS